MLSHGSYRYHEWAFRISVDASWQSWELRIKKAPQTLALYFSREEKFFSILVGVGGKRDQGTKMVVAVFPNDIILGAKGNIETVWKPFGVMRAWTTSEGSKNKFSSLGIRKRVALIYSTCGSMISSFPQAMYTYLK